MRRSFFGLRRPPRSSLPRPLTVTALALVVGVAPALAFAWTPKPTAGDALVRMPGTQPDQAIAIEPAEGCFDCHVHYDPNAEPGFGWRGSMMGQAARDPLFWAAMTVAAQDSIFAFGTPNGTDMCERCHLPKGWLAGRSDPTNASKMMADDFDGVSCDVCHRMVDPFYVDTASGAREGTDWQGYFDEANMSPIPERQSAMAAIVSMAADKTETSATKLFDGKDFYDASGHPVQTAWDENASGQYLMAAAKDKRGPFADGSTPHDRLYSRYHKSKYFCSTCHDVSNAPMQNASMANVAAGDGSTILPTESQPAHGYFPIERTFSEFLLSDFGKQGGAAGTGAYAPGVFTTSRPGNVIAGCQDCHMPSVQGVGCNFDGALERPTGSVEHPHSGVPQHDLSGGNAWVPFLLESTIVGGPKFDATNAQLLGQGAAALTLDLGNNGGVALDVQALEAAKNRALVTLARSATLEGLAYDAGTGAASFRVVNHTGHKLLTGYPEGRRMFLRVRVMKAGAVLREVNPYDATAGTLKGLPLSYSPNSPALAATEKYDDSLVYEAHPSSTVTGESQTFHFLLSTGMSKDNRIPPKGFRVAEAGARGALPAQNGAAAAGLYTAAEYAGGYDDVALTLPAGGDSIEVELYYQTVTREYAEFLRDEIAGAGKSLVSPTPSGEPKAYIAQTDAFFGQLKAWGPTIWQLWSHNKDVPGAAPIRVARAALALATCQGQPDGTACDDGNACTTNDVCAAGACKGGAAPACDDGNPCTDDSCDPSLGCVHAYNTAPCDDGNACTAPDVCSFGLCIPGNPITCNDKDGCTTDSCDPNTGCVFTPIVPCDLGVSSSSASSSSSSSSSVAASSSSSSSSASSGSGSGGAGGAGGAPPGSGGMGGGGGMGGAPMTSSTSGHGGSSSGSGGGSKDAGGCGCEAAGSSGSNGGLAGLGVLALAGLGARRRQRR